MNRRKLACSIIILAVFFILFNLFHIYGSKREVMNEDNIFPEKSAENDRKGRITVATNRIDITDTVLKDYAQAFMEKHQGTEIVYEGIKEYEKVMTARVTSGEAPDIYYILPEMTKDTYSDFFLPIDDIGLSDKNIFFYNNCMGTDGKLYALTDTINFEGIIYNKKTFSKAGICSIPTSVEALYAACEKLKKEGVVPMGTAYRDSWPIFPWISFDTVQVQFNGEYKGANAYLEKDEIFDDAMQKSLGIFREMYRKGYLGPDIMSDSWEQLKMNLANGTTAMYYAETWYPSQVVSAGVPKEDIGMFPFPEAKYIFYQAGKYWGVSKDSKNPELAKQYLAYMLTAPAEIGAVSSRLNEKIENPFAKELLSYGVNPMDSQMKDIQFEKMLGETGLNIHAFLKRYIMEADDEKAQKEIEGWNEKWKEARSVVR